MPPRTRPDYIGKVAVADAPAKLLSLGSPTRLTTCPKCHAVVRDFDQEPCYSRCRICGSLWPIKDTKLEEQYQYELSRGLSAHASTEDKSVRVYGHKKPVNGNGHGPAAR